MAQFFSVHPDNPQARLLKQAVQLLNQGQVLAVPTDSSYALVCHLDDKAAVERMRRLRGVDDRHHAGDETPQPSRQPDLEKAFHDDLTGQRSGERRVLSGTEQRDRKQHARDCIVPSQAQTRRDAVAQAFAGKLVVIEAGGLKTRSNDTDYRFRAHAAFAHLTGWGAHTVPDSVLVIDARTEAKLAR